MDNEAFKDLVRGRAGGGGGGKKARKDKTTKEIAREAVEAEFRVGGKRRKRKRADGYDDDSDDSGGASSAGGAADDSAATKKRNWHRNQWEDNGDDEEKEEDLDRSNKYRDRAKERREGGVVAGSSGREPLRQEQQFDTMLLPTSVKGLDRSIILKVQQHRQQEERQPALFLPQDEKQALDLLSAYSSSAGAAGSSSSHLRPPTSALGKELVRYVQQTYGCSDDASRIADASFGASTSSGRAVQRSTLTFSLRADPRNWARSWEVPLEARTAGRGGVGSGAFGGTAVDDDEDDDRSAPSTAVAAVTAKMASPVDGGMIERIRKVLQRRFARQQKKHQHQQECDARISAAETAPNNNSRKKRGRGSTISNSANGSVASSKNSERNAAIMESSAVAGSDNQSEDNNDDDIFGDVGEYVPDDNLPEAGGEDASDGADIETGKPKKHSSVFDNILPQLPRRATRNNGSRGTDAREEDSHAAAPTGDVEQPERQRLTGLSSLEYDDDMGGMDADFDGRLDAREKKKKKKKKQAKKIGSNSSDSE